RCFQYAEEDPCEIFATLCIYLNRVTLPDRFCVSMSPNHNKWGSQTVGRLQCISPRGWCCYFCCWGSLLLWRVGVWFFGWGGILAPPVGAHFCAVGVGGVGRGILRRLPPASGWLGRFSARFRRPRHAGRTAPSSWPPAWTRY